MESCGKAPRSGVLHWYCLYIATRRGGQRKGSSVSIPNSMRSIISMSQELLSNSQSIIITIIHAYIIFPFHSLVALWILRDVQLPCQGGVWEFEDLWPILTNWPTFQSPDLTQLHTCPPPFHHSIDRLMVFLPSEGFCMVLISFRWTWSAYLWDMFARLFWMSSLGSGWGAPGDWQGTCNCFPAELEGEFVLHLIMQLLPDRVGSLECGKSESVEDRW